MKKKRMLFLRAAVWALLGVVAAMDLVFLFTGARVYSPEENRNLQTFPRLTARTLASGRFEAQFDDYVADQFPFRTMWIRLKAAADRMMGRTESNGVFLGRDGYLIQDFTPPDEARYADTLAALKAFSARHPDLAQYLLVAPSAVTVHADKLPALAPAGDEGGYIDRLRADLSGTALRFVDVRVALAERAGDEQLYYRTDHHWTTDGAYLAYLEFAKVAGLSSDAQYRRALLSDDFSGTLTAMSGFRMSQTDPLYAYLPDAAAPCVVTYVAEGVVSASMYRADCLEARDQYTVFFGGNHPQVRIETASESGRALLVIKDSYANCFVPFLAADYRKIVMVDPRYYTGDLETLIAAEGIDEVLFLYNAATLAGDTALRHDIG